MDWYLVLLYFENAKSMHVHYDMQGIPFLPLLLFKITYIFFSSFLLITGQ